MNASQPAHRPFLVAVCRPDGILARDELASMKAIGQLSDCDLPREFGKGLHVWETGVNECSWLHVSAGLGTSPYAKVRIATRPEVSILTIHD